MKAVLAISGGIDSMVMLDMMWGINKCSPNCGADSANSDIIVAHFNHGTRLSSEDDVTFVRRKAAEYRVGFNTEDGKLGENVSEEIARSYRYKFLRKISDENDGTEIYTAHHLDDLVESVTINLLRGTGWRGLAVLDTPGIRRPFLEPELLPEDLYKKVPLDKAMIRKYAAEHEIAFRQDPTNNEDNYLRNRLRKNLAGLKDKNEIYELWQKQKKLKREIDSLVQDLMPKVGEPWQRSWFRDLDEKVALELLRAGVLRADISATRPQLEDFRQAILNYTPGKFFNFPGDKLVKFTKTSFVL